MIFWVFSRLRRNRISSLSVLLFAVILSAVLCSLHAANTAEIENYERVYQTLPIEVTVSNLAGTKTDGLDIPGWVLELFTGEGVFKPDISEYVTDIQVKLQHEIEVGPAKFLAGITSTRVAEELLQENGGRITWYTGYEESIFMTDSLVCVVPEEIAQGKNEVSLDFKYMIDEHTIKKYSCTLTVVGTYVSDMESSVIFCPLNVTEQVYRELGEDRRIDTVSARLANNEQLEDFQMRSSLWFADLNPTGAQTEWGFGGYAYYPFALDINDSLLKEAALTLENSIFLNTLCTYLVFVLSAGAGFFVGFLMIRSRKREIMLMRTLGEANSRVYLSFALEQMLCAVLGTAVGGAFFLWQPMDKLALFCLIYFVGLSAALFVFLRGNLLSSMKEEE